MPYFMEKLEEIGKLVSTLMIIDCEYCVAAFVIKLFKFCSSYDTFVVAIPFSFVLSCVLYARTTYQLESMCYTPEKPLRVL